MLSFSLSPQLLTLLHDLDNAFTVAFGELKTLSAEELMAVQRYARISTIGASTRIENAQLTDSEINWLDTILTEDGKITAFDKNRQLIENKLSKDRERSIEEVAGCRQMLFRIYENAQVFYPLREMDIRALHYELMAPYEKNSTQIGVYKTQPNTVIEKNHRTGESRIVFQTAEAGPITSAAMHDLVAWYNDTKPQEPWIVALACELVYRFLAIHPFQDGNGRLGRGLFLLALLQSDNQAIAFTASCLAIDRNIEKHKEEYYFVLNQCSNGKFSVDPSDYRIEYFLRFMIKIIKKSLADIEIYRKKYQQTNKLSAAAAEVLMCFKENPEIRLNTQMICAKTQLPRRTVIYALTNLLAAQLIQKYGQAAGTRYQIVF